jgi:hypothetical protein
MIDDDDPFSNNVTKTDGFGSLSKLFSSVNGFIRAAALDLELGRA